MRTQSELEGITLLGNTSTAYPSTYSPEIGTEYKQIAKDNLCKNKKPQITQIFTD